MATPAPQQHPAAPVPVLVDEEYGYRSYVNMVADPDNPTHAELGAHLDVGPQAVTHRVHYHFDEIESSAHQPRWSHLSKEQVENVVLGKRDYVGTALEAARLELDRSNACTLDILRDIWKQRVREAMFNGEILGQPSWLQAAEQEEHYNHACSGADFRARRALVYELILEGRVEPDKYASLKPTYSERASSN